MIQEMDTLAAQDKLKILQLKQQELAQQLGTTDFIWNGSISKRFLTCGKPSLPCHRDTEAKHGPYYYWTTKKAGKTISKSLTEQQAEILQQWISNRRKLERILNDMKKLSHEAYECIFIIMEHAD